MFYFSGYRLTVFHWATHGVLGSFSFHPDEAGLNDFRKYLISTDKTPVRLLIDIIEEDFRRETMPHVNGRDRHAMIERLIERHYRSNTDYVSYRVTGRETSGRRDDIVSISVLPNPDLFGKWLDIMQELDIALAGVWSLPLLAPRVMDILDVKDENILLVSQQVPSNLRQTFIRKGEVVNSRATVINTHHDSIGRIIHEEVEHNTRFLSNQRIINFDDVVNVYVLADEDKLPEIRQHCADSGLINYHLYDHAPLKHRAGLRNSTSEFCNDLFSWLCARQRLPRGNYGGRELFSGFRRYIASRTLKVASFVAAVASVALSVSFVSDIVVLQRDTDTNIEYARVLENSYRQQLSSIEDELKKTPGLESAVSMYNAIKQSRDVSPLNFMARISSLLSPVDMNDVVLTQIDWEATTEKKLPREARRKKDREAYTSVRDVNHKATIKGYVRVSLSSIKQAVDKVDRMVEILRDHPQVIDINVVHLPLDVRPESSVQLETGANLEARPGDSQRGRFEIELLMREAGA